MVVVPDTELVVFELPAICLYDIMQFTGRPFQLTIFGISHARATLVVVTEVFRKFRGAIDGAEKYSRE